VLVDASRCRYLPGFNGKDGQQTSSEEREKEANTISSFCSRMGIEWLVPVLFGIMPSGNYEQCEERGIGGGLRFDRCGMRMRMNEDVMEQVQSGRQETESRCTREDASGSGANQSQRDEKRRKGVTMYTGTRVTLHHDK
jgi:hypothetical protein